MHLVLTRSYPLAMRWPVLQPTDWGIHGLSPRGNSQCARDCSWVVPPCCSGLSAYPLDLFGFGMYPVAQGEWQLATCFPAPFAGTETTGRAPLGYVHTCCPPCLCLSD